MGVFGDLFGGSESTQGPVDVTPDEFQALRQPVATTLRGLFESLGGLGFAGGSFPGVSDPSRFTAGLGEGENALLAQLQGLLGGGGGATGQATDFLKSVLSGEGLTPGSNPFLQATIEAQQRPLIEQFKDFALPRFQSQFTAAGQRTQPEGSSAFDQSAALATRGLTNALADISTNLSGQNFQQERNRQIQAVTQAGELQTQDVQNTIQGLQAAALPRLIEQFGIDRGLEEFNRRINTVLQAIQLAQGLPLVSIGQEGTSKTRPDVIGGLTDIADVASKFFNPAAGSCWVAREVYGEDNPRWHKFQTWLLTRAPSWFAWLYRRFGERFARMIRPYPLVKAVIRWWMDTRIRG